MDQSSLPAQARAVIDSVILRDRFGVEVFASLFPVLPIGADGLAGQDRCSRVALAPIAVATRPQGAPLTVILGGKRKPGTEDGPGPLQARPSRQRYGGDRRPAEAGSPTWRRRRARRATARRSATWPSPRSRTVAPPAPRFGPGGGARLGAHPPLDDLAPLPASRPFARRLACRRRALEAVEKVAATTVEGAMADRDDRPLPMFAPNGLPKSDTRERVTQTSKPLDAL